jgi:hypothetical protein
MFFLVLYELLTGNHLIGSKGSVVLGFKMNPTAFFYNPNDFATVISLFLPVLYCLSQMINSNRKFIILCILSLFFVLVTLSRLSLLFLLVFPFFILYIKSKLQYLVILLGVFTVLVFILVNIDYSRYANKDSLVGYNINKFQSIFNISDNDYSNSVNSMTDNIRYKVYAPIINTPQDFIIGKGFVASELLYKEKIIPLENAHSYWAEGIFNFGFIGFFPILFILITIFSISVFNSNINYFYKCVIVQFIYFIFLLNIPSSVMSLPIVWLPIAIMLAILFNSDNYKNLNATA